MATLTLGTTNLSASNGNWTSAPAGTVVQSATTAASGSIAADSSSVIASGLITTLTPRLSGSKFLTILSGVSAHSNKASSDNHGTIYYMYVSVAGGTYANVAADVTGSHFINDSISNWIDVPLAMTYLSTPSYTAGQTVAFQPHYARSTNSSSTCYFHHTGHTAAASQVYNLTVLEIAS
tara:strand:- start:54 stop:590 length:537 start_codon:yes stop_codon:yes gene_type:complete